MRHLETQIQRAIVNHLKSRAHEDVCWWHTPNGAWHGGSWRQGKLMKSMGARPGVADLILIHAGKAYALELKAEGGRASEGQLAFLADFDRAGGFTSLSVGVDEAVAALEAWNLLRC